MKANVTFLQVYFNKSLSNFFFRTQAVETMDELLDRASDRRKAVELLNDYCDNNFEDLDELEELLYNDSVEDIAELVGIELINIKL